MPDTNSKMPIVIYMFGLCAFAVGLTEFITIGLLPEIAESLHVGISDVGLTVTLYAAGVVIGAPVLTALSSGLRRKTVIVLAIAMFTLGNFLSGCASSLLLLLAGRFLCGLAHGVFFAVASSVAARLVQPERSGAALSLVFGGVTIAMSLGVPIGSWLGTFMHWQIMFFMIATISALGCGGISILMPKKAGDTEGKLQGIASLGVLFDRHLLAGASVPMLSYMGSFVLYTYVSPLLLEHSNTSTAIVSIAMLAYGIGSAAGIVVGGRVSDRFGMDNASTLFLIGIGLSLILIYTSLSNGFVAVCAIALLGFTTYGVLPGLQARILMLASRHAPHALDIASGMNIAAFNSGVVVGSAAGAAAISKWGFSSLALFGALLVAIACAVLSWQRSLASMSASSGSSDIKAAE